MYHLVSLNKIAMLFGLVLMPVLSFIPSDAAVAVSWEHKIFVDSNNGTDSESCLKGDMNYPCATFNMALKGLKYNSVVIYISPGIYTLKYGNETTIENKGKIAIVGGDGDTIIKCSPFTGLVVEYSDNVVIENIIFHGCGQETLSELIVTVDKYKFMGISRFIFTLHFQAALSIRYSSNVLVNNVKILFSNGTGLLLQGIQGNLTVLNSLMSNGSASLPNSYSFGSSYLIGGGIIVALYEGINFLISGCNITNNVVEFSRSNPNLDFGMIMIDKPAGITLIPVVCNTPLLVESCIVTNNTSGFFLEGNDNCSIVIRNTKLNSNLNSSIVKSESDHDVTVSLSNMNITDTVMIVSDTLKSLHTSLTPEMYEVTIGHVEISIIFSDKNLGGFPLSFEEMDFTSKQFDVDVHPGLCSDDKENFNGFCPVSYSLCYNQHFCSCSFGHTGRLCGRCEDGYSVAINSHYLECVPCSEQGKIAKGWSALIGLEFVPLTIMVAVIAILNVNLNQGSLNAYTFFCQILTLSFPSVGYPAWLVTNFNYEHRLHNIYLIPLSIWNLEFINFPSYYSYYTDEPSFSLCISTNTSPLGALSFWYVIAFFPLVLLALLYILVILYGKGCSCVVFVVKPVHHVLVPLWRRFDINSSLTTTLASIYTLCFTQLAAISLKILHPAWYHSKYSENVTVFFYDGTQQYFKGWHAVAGSFAVLVLLFLIVSSLYLSVYPFQWFQKCFNKLKFKKDFLVSVTDVFTGPYKDGTQQNSWDYRHFAGLHFFLRLVIMLFYYIPQSKSLLFVIPVLEVTVCFLVVITILIFRPYKRNIHTFNEVLLFMMLGVFSCYSFYKNADIDYNRRYENIWFEVGILPVTCVIILFFVIPYCVYWMVKTLCRAKCTYSSKSIFFAWLKDHNKTVINEEMDCADRLLNPERYI